MNLVFGACIFDICIKQCHYLADFNVLGGRTQGSPTYLVPPHIGTEQYSHLWLLPLSVMQ